jgi:hypothetical protein
MFRRLFQNSQNGNGSALDEGDPDISNGMNASGRRKTAVSPSPWPAKNAALGQFDSFEEIYRTTPAATPEGSYNILKVAEMLKSSHLAGLSMDTKRAALMMALEAAGAEVKDILQDAMLRQRALNDYEEAQQKILREFESAKGDESRKIQAELESVTAQYMARIQANVDEVGQQQDAFRNWQKTKQHESAVIADATTYCNVPDNALDNLTVALERSSVRR